MSERARGAAAAAAAFGAGLVFGLGLAISGMTRPVKVIGFLDFFGGRWDPSLLFVMGSAVLVTALAFRLILRRARPVLAASFAVPRARTIDGRLVGGAVIFGVGWGLGGFCPGPAIVSLVSGSKGPLVFTAAMVAGMLLFDAVERVRLRLATTPVAEESTADAREDA